MTAGDTGGGDAEVGLRDGGSLCLVDSEAALVAKQLSAPRGKGTVWTAWRNIGPALREYGKQLAEERFDEIKASVAKL